jgi:hypothetical protein
MPTPEYHRLVASFLPAAREAILRGDFDSTFRVRPCDVDHYVRHVAQTAAADFLRTGRAQIAVPAELLPAKRRAA